MIMINELVKSKLRAKFISREATSGMISLARKNEEKIFKLIDMGRPDWVVPHNLG